MLDIEGVVSTTPSFLSAACSWVELLVSMVAYLVTEKQLWSVIVQDYSDGLTRAHRSEIEQRFIEYREELTPAKSLYYRLTISQE